MKILYLCSDYGIPIFGIKGASVHMRSLARGFHREGDELTIVSPRLDLPDGRPSDLNVVELRLTEAEQVVLKELRGAEKFLQKKNRVPNEVRSLLYNRHLATYLRQRLASQPVDFILERYSLFSYAGLQVAREFGVPFLLEVNAILTREQEAMRGLHLKDVALAIEDQLFRQADRILTVSDWLKEYITSRGVPSERIRVLPNGIDPELFPQDEQQRRQFRQQLGGDEHFLVGFSGSLKSWHGMELLIEVLPELIEQIPKVKTVIIGDGPMGESLRQLTRQLGVDDRVVFTGRVEHEAIGSYLAALDVAVAPYRKRTDFYFSPIKIFEYMAAGVPIVTTPQGQISRILTDGKTGLFFPAEDRQQFIRQIVRLYREPDLRHKLAQNARNLVMQRYTWQQNVRQIKRLVEELLATQNKE